MDPEVLGTHVGGALWWRRWSAPRSAAHVWMALPWLGLPVTDSIVGEEFGFLEAELDDWDAGRFMLHGETLALEWLSPEESRELAVTEFDL